MWSELFMTYGSILEKGYNNNNKSIYKAQHLVCSDYSKHIHTHTPTHTGGQQTEYLLD